MKYFKRMRCAKRMSVVYFYLFYFIWKLETLSLKNSNGSKSLSLNPPVDHVMKLELYAPIC